MKPAPLLVVLLPLLFGGCGEKGGKTGVVGSLEWKIEGYAVTISDCDESASGKLEIPATIKGKAVTSIGFGAFEGCSRLTSITIGDSVTSIGAYAFARCTTLTSITIPDSVTSIGRSAFWRCHSLTGITIPDSVTSIEVRAFAECTSLTSITIGDGVTSIRTGTFRDCTSLTSITIPDGVTSIGGWAFDRCTSLAAVTFLGDAPKGRQAFKGATPTIYRNPEAKGWGETFADRPVKLISEKP